jgi:hypothetical protein
MPKPDATPAASATTAAAAAGAKASTPASPGSPPPASGSPGAAPGMKHCTSDFDLGSGRPGASESAAVASPLLNRQSPRDLEDAAKMLPILAALIVLPLSLSNVYEALSDGNGNYAAALVHVAYFGVVAVTFSVLASKFPGELMIVAMGVLGCLNELFDFGMNKAAYEAVTNGFWWIFVAVAIGATSGAFCKAKDIVDYRFRRDHSYHDRLYLMAPYIIGVWVAHVMRVGWAGLLTVFSSVFFLLAVVGYGTLAWRLLRQSGVASSGDLLSIFRVLASASFGTVLAAAVAFSVVFFYLLTPIWLSMAKRLPHTLISGVCIVIEIVVYDLVN